VALPGFQFCCPGFRSVRRLSQCRSSSVRSASFVQRRTVSFPCSSHQSHRLFRSCSSVARADLCCRQSGLILAELSDPGPRSLLPFGSRWFHFSARLCLGLIAASSGCAFWFCYVWMVAGECRYHSRVTGSKDLVFLVLVVLSWYFLYHSCKVFDEMSVRPWLAFCFNFYRHSLTRVLASIYVFTMFSCY
jgi:hypothetical protein